jgi:hypothetical protein
VLAHPLAPAPSSHQVGDDVMLELYGAAPGPAPQEAPTGRSGAPPATLEAQADALREGLFGGVPELQTRVRAILDVAHATAAKAGQASGVSSACGALCAQARRVGGMCARLFCLQLYLTHPKFSVCASYNPRSPRAYRFILVAAIMLTQLYIVSVMYAFRHPPEGEGGEAGGGGGARGARALLRAGMRSLALLWPGSNVTLTEPSAVTAGGSLAPPPPPPESDILPFALPGLTTAEEFVVSFISLAVQIPISMAMAWLTSRAGDAAFSARYPFVALELERRLRAEAKLATMAPEELQAMLGLTAEEVSAGSGGEAQPGAAGSKGGSRSPGAMSTLLQQQRESDDDVSLAGITTLVLGKTVSSAIGSSAPPQTPAAAPGAGAPGEEGGYSFGWVDAPHACVLRCSLLLRCCGRHPDQKSAFIANRRSEAEKRLRLASAKHAHVARALQRQQASASLSGRGKVDAPEATGGAAATAAGAAASAAEPPASMEKAETKHEGLCTTLRLAGKFAIVTLIGADDDIGDLVCCLGNSEGSRGLATEEHEAAAWAAARARAHARLEALKLEAQREAELLARWGWCARATAACRRGGLHGGARVPFCARALAAPLQCRNCSLAAFCYMAPILAFSGYAIFAILLFGVSQPADAAAAFVTSFAIIQAYTALWVLAPAPRRRHSRCACAAGRSCRPAAAPVAWRQTLPWLPAPSRRPLPRRTSFRRHSGLRRLARPAAAAAAAAAAPWRCVRQARAQRAQRLPPLSPPPSTGSSLCASTCRSCWLRRTTPPLAPSRRRRRHSTPEAPLPWACWCAPLPLRWRGARWAWRRWGAWGAWRHWTWARPRPTRCAPRPGTGGARLGTKSGTWSPRCQSQRRSRRAWGRRTDGGGGA